MAELFGLQGRLVAVAGQADALATILLEVAEALADAAGCRIYLVSHPPDDPDSVWVTSIWADRASHDAARSDERVRSLLQRAWPLIRARAEETELRPIGGKGV